MPEPPAPSSSSAWARAKFLLQWLAELAAVISCQRYCALYTAALANRAKAGGAAWTDKHQRPDARDFCAG